MNFTISTFLGDFDIAISFKTAPKIAKKAKGIYEVIFQDKDAPTTVKEFQSLRKVAEIKEPAIKKMQESPQQKNSLPKPTQPKQEEEVEAEEKPVKVALKAAQENKKVVAANTMYKAQVNGPSLQVVGKSYGKNTLQNKLQFFMTKQNWTQKSLSEKTGISQADISKMLSGRRAIGQQVGKKFAQAFAIDPQEFS